LNYNPEATAEMNRPWIEELHRNTIRTIDRSGGTYLHTSRLIPSKMRPDDIPAFLKGRLPVDPATGLIDCTPKILDAIDRLGLDALVAIGGDDTLAYGVRLHKEGVKLISIPKTMDNDVFGTDYCL